MWTSLKNFFFPSHFTFPFDPSSNIIQVPVLLQNQEQELFTNFALDTGATYTVVDESVAHFLDLKAENNPSEILTAGGNQEAFFTTIPKLSIGSLSQQNSPAIITDLPEDAGVTGLLGLSNLKKYTTKIDYENGKIHLKNLYSNL